ncbi:MAG TPA: hypothetical protein VEY07_04285 [Thermoplasmata archaeon]|nr:hypothetical protein [Thermoplasmata archaeon]
MHPRHTLRSILILLGIVGLLVAMVWIVGVVSGVITVNITRVTWQVVGNGIAEPGYSFTGSCTTVQGNYHPDYGINCQLRVWGPNDTVLNTRGSVTAAAPFSAGIVPPEPCYTFGCPSPPLLNVVIVTPWVPGAYSVQAEVNW